MELQPTIILCLGAFLLNLPFGFYRAGTRKLSWQWFVAIHFPVLLIIVARLVSGVSWHAIPLVFASDIAGQLLGGMLRPAVKVAVEPGNHSENQGRRTGKR
ncbi:MAG: hypothetical protein Q7K29_06755 [Thermoleophilia bacterium]|nr:hypothetical protein [Thermoleophilia bacterium]